MPVIVTIGNHEVVRGYTYNHEDYEPTDAFRAEMAPYFYALWAFPGQPGYNVLDFGDYLSIVALDSMHTNDAGGEQAEWLRRVLAERRRVPHVFPVYHVAGWASVKGIEYRHEQIGVREYFHPAFEEHGVRVAFENHDHAYKRTPPRRGGEVVEPGEGVVYIGDGAWGVSTRDHIRHLDAGQIKHSEEHGITEIRERGINDGIDDIWYLEEFVQARHFILATIDGDSQHFLAVDEHGQVIDEYTEDGYRPADLPERASATLER